MTFAQFMFYTFAAILLFAGIRVVSARNPVHSAMFLVLAFFTSAGLWLMLEAEFLAISLVLVYVGAVMVLFLFVVMMLDLNTTRRWPAFTGYLPAGLAVGGLITVEVTMVLVRRFGLDKVPAPAGHGAGYSNTHELGTLLYTQYIYPFEIAAVLLLVAIVAAIALTLRRRPQTKYQDPATHVVVKRDDRVRLVKMPSEGRQ